MFSLIFYLVCSGDFLSQGTQLTHPFKNTNQGNFRTIFSVPKWCRTPHKSQFFASQKVQKDSFKKTQITGVLPAGGAPSVVLRTDEDMDS